jgi:hypothetical protein
VPYAESATLRTANASRRLPAGRLWNERARVIETN